MAWGKTEEEKRAAAAAKAEAAAERAKAKAEAEYWASPVGQAVQAKQRRQRFFQVTIPVSTLDGYSNLAWGSGDVSNTTHAEGVTDPLTNIENAGWHLEHASWVFLETGTSSRDKVLASGQKATTTGRVDGVYLFRAVN